MKRLLFILISLLSICSGVCLAEELTVSNCFLGSYAIVSYGGETLYLDSTRETVLMDGKEYSLYWGTYCFSDIDALETVLLRQDGQQFYCYDQQTKADVLLFDFDLKRGDTYTDNIDNVSYKVTDVRDTITDGKSLRLIELRSAEGNHDIWMEGVGSIYTGVLRACRLHKDAHLVLCGKTDDWDYQHRFQYSGEIFKSADMKVQAEDFYAWMMAHLDEVDESQDAMEELTKRWNHLETELNAEFDGDALHVWGRFRGSVYPYITCALKGDAVSVQFYKEPGWNLAEGLAQPYQIDARIPGFRKGKYHVALFGKTFDLECLASSSDLDSQVITFEQGKTWCLMVIGTYPNPGEIVGYNVYTIDGTAELDGQTYCRVTRQMTRLDGSIGDVFEHEFFVRESEGKIYRKSTFWLSPNEPEDLYFDCNMKEGDTNIYGQVLKQIETRAVDGIEGMKLRHYLFGKNSIKAEYIEGVGYTDGHWFDLYGPTGSNAKLIYCKTADGKFMYGSEIPAGVSAPTSNRESSPLHDLQGRQLQHEPARGVFIKDGRKWVK